MHGHLADPHIPMHFEDAPTPLNELDDEEDDMDEQLDDHF